MHTHAPLRSRFSPEPKCTDARDQGARKAFAESLECRRLFAGSPASLAALFSADSLAATNDAAISAWQDSSGNGYTATQAVPSESPTYLASAIDGHPALVFSAASSTQLSFARPVSGDFTLIVVFKSTQGLGQGTNWYDGAGLVDGEVAGVANDFGLSLNSFGQVLGGTGMPDTTAASATGFNDGRPHVASFVRAQASGALWVYVDGQLLGRATGGTQPLTAPGRLTIGSIQANTNYFTGDIAQVQVYSAALSGPVRASVESPLKTEYDIGSAPRSYFSNPVINSDFADPGVLQAGGSYFLFGTNNFGENVQAEESTNLVNWSSLPDALPTLPVWAHPGRTWAPDAALMANGKYDLYYTAWSNTNGREAVGVAVSDTPAGPYTPMGSSPLVADFDQGGAIDPSVFTSSAGGRYLLWKNDGNAVGQDTSIYIQQLSSDGLSLLGTRTQLIKEDQPWEGSVVEAPTLWQHGNTYDLFYSGNSFSGSAYATGYATSTSLLGPYQKPAQPLLQTTNGVIGPGGPTITVGPDGNTYMLYHSWQGNYAYRGVNLSRLTWNGATPVIVGPTLSPQPVPVHSAVLGRYVFYNNSSFDGNDPQANIKDDNAIAPDKNALLPGQTATFANYTSFSRGINGIMIDVSRLAASTLAASDFALQVGNRGDPTTWSDAPAPTSIIVRPGEGVNGSDRIELTWADHMIQDQWLRVTIKANADTALAADDVFYFGNEIGETGNSPTDTDVDVSDQLHVRANAILSAAITNVYDFNRDGQVDVSDQLIARYYSIGGVNALRLITAV